MSRALALVIAMAGCGACMDSGPHHVQAPADDHQRAIVESAASAWTEAGCPIVVGADGAVVHFVDFGTLPCESGDKCGGTYDGTDVWVRNDKLDAETGKILKHELGHMLGFKHRDYGIMKPLLAPNVVTPEDCDESLHR